MENISRALAHMSTIRKSTSDTEIRNLCVTATNVIAAESIIINDDIDPAAELKNVSLDPIFAGISECNSIADNTSSETIKQSCREIVQALTAVMHKLI